MSMGVRAGIGVVLAVATMVAVGALTRYGYTAVPESEASLRLAWRARVPLVEECRRLTEEEQADLPVHMRRDVVCEGRVASYRLEVRVDGELRRRGIVEGGGARGDRPIYVFDALPLNPGPHRIRVTFERIRDGQASGEGADRGEDELRGEGETHGGGEIRGDGEDRGGGEDPDPGAVDSGPHARSGAGIVPDRLVLERTVDVGSREVVLVTYDPGRRALVLR